MSAPTTGTPPTPGPEDITAWQGAPRARDTRLAGDRALAAAGAIWAFFGSLAVFITGTPKAPEVIVGSFGVAGLWGLWVAVGRRIPERRRLARTRYRVAGGQLLIEEPRGTRSFALDTLARLYVDDLGTVWTLATAPGSHWTPALRHLEDAEAGARALAAGGAVRVEAPRSRRGDTR